MGVKTSFQNLCESLKILLSHKVDKVSGKGLSTNDYTTAEKNKLAGIAEGANKYALPSATSTTLGGVKVDTTLNATSTNPVQNKAATTELNNIKSKTINGVALSSGQNLIVPRSSKSLLSTQGVNGTDGYIKFATITALGGYIDHPHYFRIHIRNEVLELNISFLGSGSTLAKVNYAVVTTEFNIIPTNIYYANSSNTTVDLYFKKRNAYDDLFVEDYLHADRFEGARDKIEFKSEFTTTLPEGAVLIPTKADPNEIAADVASLQAKTADTGWKTTSNLKYRKSGYIVGLQGTVTPTTSTMSITLGTLPEGCRPSQYIYIAQSHTDTPSRRLIIDTKGVVTMLFASNCTASHSYAYNGIFML